MRILFVLLFLLTTSVQSNTLPTKEGKIFWDENLQESYERADFKVGLNNFLFEKIKTKRTIK